MVAEMPAVESENHRETRSGTMIMRGIVDWSGAYANGVNIPRGDSWPAAWSEPAKAFRERTLVQGRAELDIPYGDGPRHRYDLFSPLHEPKGVVVYIHGGYWMQFGKSDWSHLAKGLLEQGYAVAMPSYTLCPEIRIAGIVREVGRAVTAVAGRCPGPIFLTGHSAGGHLATRMISADSLLPESVRRRIRHVVSISGLHDLRPLMRTGLNETLHLDEAEAITESPALLRPMEGARVTCWVGGAERSEFVRQNALLANIWLGLGAETAAVEEPDRHHFNIVDGLADPDHPLTQTLLFG
jgi:acetyl esterase/lipase